jgi:hypothetical protein
MFIRDGECVRMNVVRGEGGGGDAVDRVGGSGVPVVVTATRRLFAWSELKLWHVRESWSEHAGVHFSPRSPAVPAATSENIPMSLK